MKPGNNTYHITITYQDAQHKDYSYEKDFSIMSKADFFQSLSLYFNQLVFWIENMF